MATTTVQLPDGRTLTAESNMVEVTSLGGQERDPDWTHTDSHGHEHRAESGTGRHLDYPTLRYVVDQEDYTVDEGDGVMEEYPGWGHWECVTCGDEITPGTRHSPGGPAFLPGAIRYTLDGESITEDEAAALIQAAGGVQA